MAGNEQEMLKEEPTVRCAHHAMVDPATLKPHPENPNIHPENQLELMAGVLRSNGWRKPIVVSRRSGFITVGHGRLQTSLYMKLKAVPVEYQEYADEQAEIRDLIADNRIAQHSYMDALGLGNLLRKLSAADQKDLGYSQEEMALFTSAEYKAPTATSREFKVLETLKMTKESKAVISRAVQQFCVLAKQELDWGEVLANICVQWEAAGSPMPKLAPRAPEPVPAPPAPPAPAPTGHTAGCMCPDCRPDLYKEPDKSAKEPAPVVPEQKPKGKGKAAKAAPAQAPAPPPGELVALETRTVVFVVDYVAQTELEGKAVFSIRQRDGKMRLYTDDLGIADLAKYLEGKEARFQVKDEGGHSWAKSVIKA